MVEVDIIENNNCINFALADGNGVISQRQPNTRAQSATMDKTGRGWRKLSWLGDGGGGGSTVGM